jgi:predicted  nucleic acid-binding Zn-ribbon protein
MPTTLPHNATLHERAQHAYINGNTELAEAYERIAALENEVEALQEQLDDIETLDDWERRNGPAEAYQQFFYACFERLPKHYPAPSITSDYDKSVIFDIIAPPV